MRPAPAASALFLASLAVATLTIAALIVTRPAAMPFDHPKLSIDDQLAIATKFQDARLRPWIAGSHSDETEEIERCALVRSSGDCDLYSHVQFHTEAWREMVWFLVAGLGVGLIGLAGATRRVQPRRSLILILLACVAWMPGGVPPAVIFTGWMLIAYIAIMRAHRRAPIA